jgi:hypothetical protein
LGAAEPSCRNNEIVDGPFELIDLAFSFDDLAGEARITPDDRLDRGGELIFRKAAHFEEHPNLSDSLS